MRLFVVDVTEAIHLWAARIARASRSADYVTMAEVPITQAASDALPREWTTEAP